MRAVGRSASAARRRISGWRAAATTPPLVPLRRGVGCGKRLMPVGPYEDFAACVADQREQGEDEASAKRICGAMEREMNKAQVLVLVKSSPERRYTLGVVYEPDVVDTQGDFAKAEDIEDAAWAFMMRLQSLAKAS